MKRCFAAALSSVALLVATHASAAAIYPERAYQEHWCGQNGGVTEVTLADRTRVDCLTATHAVEVDFARKWAEAIGQSLYYARATGRAPGVVLILEAPGDRRFLRRIGSAVRETGIVVWTITPDEIDGTGRP